MTETEKLAAVETAIRNYHFALDMRQHAASAAHQALDAIEKAIDLPWEQGAEMQRRQARVKPEKELPKNADS